MFVFTIKSVEVQISVEQAIQLIMGLWTLCFCIAARISNK